MGAPMEHNMSNFFTPSLTVSFDTGNAAFCEGNGQVEAARVLKHIAACIEFKGDTSGTVRDFNGNHIGEWSVVFPVEEDEEEPHPEDDPNYVEFPAGEFPPQANVGPLED